MKRFALLGAAGFVAPRHMASIKALGCDLIAAVDPFDSVGVLDQYFPRCIYFKDIGYFKKYAIEQKASGLPIDYLVICTPNDLHLEHCLLGLSLGMDIICEKPLVLTSADLELLVEAQRVAQKSIHTILQLRLHPVALKLKQYVDQIGSEAIEVKIQYKVLRGDWYFKSWKGCNVRSGGIATNIGIHLFDLLIWLFGTPRDVLIHGSDLAMSRGQMNFAKAKVLWDLSIHTSAEQFSGQSPIRSIQIGELVWDLSDGFQDLHIQSYRNILVGQGHPVESLLSSIALTEEIRKKSSQH